MSKKAMGVQEFVLELVGHPKTSQTNTAVAELQSSLCTKKGSEVHTHGVGRYAHTGGGGGT